MSFIDSNYYVYLVIPLMVFFARVMDVTLGTLRIIFISRGKKNVAPILGFFEVFIWITIVSQIVSHANNILAYLAYAAGFAAGNYVGMYIESRLAIGTQVVLTIVQEHAAQLIDHLRTAGYGVTSVEGTGANGAVTLIYTIVRRRNLKYVLSIIHETHPRAFLSVQDINSTQEGIFPMPTTSQIGVFYPLKLK
ncbi:MAG: hypothetical protein C3F13_13965 [Anaerolineales bacterium]|nr:DUF2179 domain-containing protein [Anaerolineae bacterium]PWB51537.1 MAG: hypothetical protein C3F13_13965 [Anaerolineales bacterium]